MLSVPEARETRLGDSRPKGDEAAGQLLDDGACDAVLSRASTGQRWGDSLTSIVSVTLAPGSWGRFSTPPPSLPHPLPTPQ